MEEDQKGPSKATHLGFRGSAELTRRLDRVCAGMGERVQGVEISRSAVMKKILETELPYYELQFVDEEAPDKDAELASWIWARIDFLIVTAKHFNLPVPESVRELAESASDLPTDIKPFKPKPV
jgi:hypothetical protein